MIRITLRIAALPIIILLELKQAFLVVSTV
nr:MAG TPA: hypothetical protein [Caudoviricetes sp.]